ncbi:hypothetical protein CALCODRAFT_57375 [Calocera cornea HHB12733]|uniref:Uncharacterized protein n=1 Tax=Calocera cornea HHB12733 TaxID=1353952 RepID=A0A165IUT6_9BASI|nr:hypothetical protein CALCODRAFT_57375 [Calocera cornea HHB12733]
MWSTIEYILSYVQQQLRYFYYGDDRPVVMEEDCNIWPPHIYLHNIALALNNRLPDEHDRSREVAFLGYGSAHVVSVIRSRSISLLLIISGGYAQNTAPENIRRSDHLCRL